jgi:hypothetical protein
MTRRHPVRRPGGPLPAAISGRPQPAAAALAVDDYLRDVAAELPGPARAHSRILAELRSGLLDAADGHQEAGLPPARAAQAAVAEFGDPSLIAGSFAAEIAASQARQVAVVLLVTGPLVGLLWIGTAAASHYVFHLAALWHLTGSRSVFSLGIQLVVVAATVTAWAAVVGIAATGRLTRWLPFSPRRAPTAVAVAGFGAVGADALGLALLAGELAMAPGRLSVLPATAAAVASLGRLLLARRAARRCLSLRARLA